MLGMAYDKPLTPEQRRARVATEGIWLANLIVFVLMAVLALRAEPEHKDSYIAGWGIFFVAAIVVSKLLDWVTFRDD